jgi:hypothetical protein
MSTNGAFYGKLIGDLSGATNYPEPLWATWNATRTNWPSFTETNVFGGVTNVKYYDRGMVTNRVQL